MAQANRKRRRKHRGTQAGTIERAGRTSRPGTARGSRQTAPATASERRAARLDREPTWRGSINRALIGAVLVAIVIGATNKDPARGAVVGVLLLIFYIPLTYYLDRAMYRRRQRQKRRG
ncbi:MAG: hypothetical protein NVSMB25_06950 [Thermoleophilaceae bacterium]